MQTWVTLEGPDGSLHLGAASTEPSHADLGDNDARTAGPIMSMLQRSPVMQTWVTGGSLPGGAFAG